MLADSTKSLDSPEERGTIADASENG